MFRTSFRIAAVSLALSLSACPPFEDEPPQDDQSYVAPTVISQELGPEGGDIVAPEDSELAGVKLHVPAGALSAKTTITIDLYADEVMLKGAAERVGPQIVVGPADVSFSVPVELTVPLDPLTVARHVQTHEDCKVWFRTDGDWQRLERKTSSENSVTVDMPSPGKAAAGVVSKTASLFCNANPANCIRDVTLLVPIGQQCNDPSGYCVTKLPTPTRQPDENSPGFNVVGRNLYYVHVPARGQLQVIRYNLDNGSETVMGTIDGVFGRIEDSPVAVDADGAAWVGLTTFGNVRVKPNTPTQRFDFQSPSFPVRSGRGVVFTGGKIVRIIRNSSSQLTDGVTTLPFPANAKTGGFNSARGGVQGSVMNFDSQGVFAFNFSADPASALFPAPERGSYLGAAASFVNSGVAVLRSSDDELRWITGAGTEQRVSMPPNQSLLAFDGGDFVWSTSLVSPELTISSANGGISVLPLTDAAENTIAFKEMLPRALVGVPGRNEVVLQTAGTLNQRKRDFYLIRRAN